MQSIDAVGGFPPWKIRMRRQDLCAAHASDAPERRNGLQPAELFEAISRTARHLASLEENAMSDDETVQRLRDFREQLEAEVWPAATEAAAEYHVDQVTHLVQLKARIDALTWAIDHRPRERAKIGF